MNKNILLIAIITCVNSTYGAIFTLNNQSPDPIWVRINAEKPPVFKKISAKTSRKFDSGIKKVSQITIVKLKEQPYKINLRDLGNVLAPLAPVDITAQVVCKNEDLRIIFVNPLSEKVVSGKKGYIEFVSNPNKFDPFDRDEKIDLPTLDMFEVYPNIAGVTIGVQDLIFKGGAKVEYKGKELSPGSIQTLKPNI